MRTQFRLDWSSLQTEIEPNDSSNESPAADDDAEAEDCNDPHIARAVSLYQKRVTTERWTVDTGLPCIDALVHVQSSADSFHTLSHFDSMPPTDHKPLDSTQDY